MFSMINVAIETEDVEVVKSILKQFDDSFESYPGAVEAIYSGISLSMWQKLGYYGKVSQ